MNSISSGRPFMMPPIPGTQPAAGAAPQQAAAPPQQAQAQAPPAQSVPTPGAPPSGNPAPGPAGPATPPPSYWASNGRSFATLPEVGQAAAAGQLPTGKNGTVNVQRIAFTDTATQQAMKKSEAGRLFKNSMIAGVAGTMAGMIPGLGPLIMMAGSLISMWNGYKAFEAFQAAQQSPPPQYTVVEEGRINPSPAGAGHYNYEAVDNDSYYNIVPSHPFGFKPGVPLEQVK